MWIRSEERRVEFEGYIAEGLDRSELSRRSGLSHATVCGILSRHGLTNQVPRSKYRQARIEDGIDPAAFREAWVSDRTNAEIAAEFHIVRSAVSKVGRRFGLDPRPTSRGRCRRAARTPVAKAERSRRAPMLKPWQEATRDRILSTEVVTTACDLCGWTREDVKLGRAMGLFRAHECSVRRAV